MQTVKLPCIRVVKRKHIVCCLPEDADFPPHLKTTFVLNAGDVFVFLERVKSVNWTWNILTRFGLLSTLCPPNELTFWEKYDA